MKKLFSLSTFFFFYGVFLSQETVSLSSSGDVSSHSQSLLLSFKSSLPNPEVLHDWLPGRPPCSFSGVTCDGESRVSAVDLSSVSLGGTNLSAVSAFLAPIEGLESLSLRSANLSGPISSFGSGVKCGSSLAAVDLSRNGLSGPISDAAVFGACPGLSELNLSSNSVEFGPSKERKEFGLRLKVLDLSLNKISGSNVIPWILARDGCGEMTHLSLKGNKISGDASFSGCKRLEYLDISSNNLSAVFASPLFGDCSAMRHLDLSGNKLAGDVSKAISGCSQLVFLNVSSNPFYAPIPSSFPSESLEFLSLSNNGFRGGFPMGLLSGCSSLVELDLSGNELSGSVPASLSACAAMESIDLSKNNFTGEFPIGTFMKLKSLKSLGLSHNWFFGELPESVFEFPRLETLDLSSNNFTGKIPGGLCDTALRNSLAELYLQNNLFTGTIPESLSNCSNLVSLDLSFNFLTGSIPRSFGSLTKLRDLILWLNNLTGEIPEVSEMRSLENLILDFNELTGSIPSGISNCTSINWISLSNNKLTGEIPKELGLLPDLAILKLSNNSLSGDIPAELGDCKSLIWLDLNTNLLTGIIPPELFKQSGHIAVNFIVSKTYVYIKNDGTKEKCHGAGNLLEFAGIRQEQLNRVSTMNPCNFARVYRGNTQPTFNHDGSMIFFDLSHNLLSGNIPKEIGKMRYLMILNLGHNDLSGSIPEELGESTNLNILDLSSNRLAGSIPLALSRLSMLMEINLSNNLLTGLIPESSQFESFPAGRFANNTGLCGYPLPPCGSTPGKTGDSGRQKSHRQASLFGSVAMGLLFSLFCIFGFVIVLIEMRKRKRKRKEAGIDVYLDTSRSNSGTANVTWNLTGAREALNINLATFDKPLQKLTFADLLEATNGFHNDSLIGKGGFGDVYKAKLKDGRTVAIKKLIHISGQGDREFTAEMETIGKIKHRNLVPLLGYCKVGEERLLVYEYMKFGSLDDVLHDPMKSGIKLNWAARRKIAIGSARGLAFLHHNCNPHIIHRDMKSSNVLLDENLEARVSDFGMARLMSTMDTHLSVSTLAGTPGYVPPEYYQSFRCSTKGDVYSYGVVLLELLTGKQPTNSIDFGDNNLVGWVKQHAKLKISDVFDPELMKEDPSTEVELLQHLRVACACLDDRHWRRPTMIQVMAMFKEIQAGSGIDSQSTIATDDVVVSSFGSVEMVGMSLKEVPELSKQ